MAARHRTREGHEVHARVADHAVGVLVRGMHELEHARGQARQLQAFGEVFGAQRRLRRVLEDHRVARHEGRHHAVDRDQIRVIPGRDAEHHAQGFAVHEAREALLRARVEIRERLRRNRDHVARAFQRAAHLVGRVARGAAHLPGELFGDLRATLFELVAETREDGRAFFQRHVAPHPLRVARDAQQLVDLSAWPACARRRCARRPGSRFSGISGAV
jgi:hypothetical protein